MATLTFTATKDASAARTPADQNDPQTFSGWNGGEEHSPVGRFGANVWDAVGRSLAYFPISFSGMNTIESAVLHFMQRNNDASNSVAHCKPTGGTALSFYVRRMVRDFGENPSPAENTWQAGGTYAWHKNAVQVNGSGQTNWVTEGQATASFTQADESWEEVDITAIVTAWWNHSKGVRNDAPNYGVIFVNTDETASSKGVDLYARDYSTARTPYIVVTYNSNTAPNVVPETGRTPSDTRVTITGAANNGSGKVRVTAASHGLTTGDKVYIKDIVGTTEANGVWNVTVITTDTFDLINSTYTNAYTSGGSLIKPTIVNTLTPTFAGNFSDPDTGDYITKIGLRVYQWVNGAFVYSWVPVISATGKPTTFNVLYGQAADVVYAGPDALTGGTVMAWAVNLMDSGGLWSPWSQYDYFIVNTPPSAPTVSILETPNNDVTTLTPTVVITHNDADPGDTLMHGYDLVVEQVGVVTTYSSGPTDLASNEWATTKQVVLPTLTDPGGNPWGKQYRAKARTKDAYNAWGAWSGWVTFTLHQTGVPVNLAPSDNETTPSVTPTFTGDRATSADTITSYQIILYDDDGNQVWDSTAISTGISNGASFSKLYNGSALTQGTFYKWKARVTSSVGGTSAYSDLKRFKTPSDAAVPTLTSPIGTGIAGGGTDPLRPAFVGERASTFDRYQIEVYPSTSTSSNLGTAHYSSGTQSSGITGAGPYVFTLAADTVTALTWNTTFKWRARVSGDGGSTWSDWSGLVSFTMDAAVTPSITAPTDSEWITDSTPDITVARGGSDYIDNMQIRVYAANGTTLLVGNSSDADLTTNLIAVAGTTTTSATWTYDGPTLTGGYYFVQARIQKYNNGPWSPWTALRRFRLNYAPDVPTDLGPEAGAILEETLFPVIQARFSDNDVSVLGDYPAEWEIVVQELDATPVDTINITTSLVVGVNEYTWQAGDTALSYNVDYQWKTRFKDSKGVWGAYSGFQSFRAAVQPTSTDIVPTDESNVNEVRPEISWQYGAQGGSAQYAVRIIVYEVVDPNDTATPPDRLAGTVNEVLALKANVYKIRSAPNYTFESNYFQNNRVYELHLFVTNEDGLTDPSPQIARIWVVLDAPDPIIGLSTTAMEDESRVYLEWTAATMLTGHTFRSYNIYKRLTDADEWAYLDSTYDRTTGNTYSDWYAGHGVQYQYRVTVVTSKAGVGMELESGDDPDGGNIAQTQLTSDVWMFVGADRDPTHIIELPVSDENHEGVVQQEAFEPLGSDRKVIIRGFVLGDEGDLQMTWMNLDVPAPWDDQVTINETLLGRRLLNYLTTNKGPHILKSPFGDVWDVQFEGPQYKWLPVGHLQANLHWIETGPAVELGV